MPLAPLRPAQGTSVGLRRAATRAPQCSRRTETVRPLPHHACVRATNPGGPSRPTSTDVRAVIVRETRRHCATLADLLARVDLGRRGPASSAIDVTSRQETIHNARERQNDRDASGVCVCKQVHGSWAHRRGPFPVRRRTVPSSASSCAPGLVRPAKQQCRCCRCHRCCRCRCRLRAAATALRC